MLIDAGRRGGSTNILATAAIMLLHAAAGIAQTPARAHEDSVARRWTGPVNVLGDQSMEFSRTLTLRDSLARYALLRSASSLTPAPIGAGHMPGFAIVPPYLRFVHNSELPYSLNDGALWAGRGANADIVAGGQAAWKGVRLLLLPEMVWSANDAYDVTVPTNFPARSSSRNQWSSPFHTQSQSIDLPIRFGDKPIRKLYPGQSSLVVTRDAVEFGAATENEWWGPGMRNALLLSNNAPGFPHLFVRLREPIATRIGTIDARWIAGGLSESDFFSVNAPKELRRIGLLAATIEPRGVSGLTLGVARAVFAPTKNWASMSAGFLDVFRDVGHPDAVSLNDTTKAPGPDQLFSIFSRMVFPSDGLEVYVEWARSEVPVSLRDLLTQPNHTQAYTIGVQWLGQEIGLTGGRIRVQGEATFLQQSSTYRFRPIGSWYTSRAVQQGYTQQGQVIGAAIGPGSSSQWLAVDHVRDSWTLGAYASRLRWLEDARSQVFRPVPLGNGWCEQDVSLLGGFRGSVATRFGSFIGDYSTGWRFNTFFRHKTNDCPYSDGVDKRMRSLTMTFAPAALRW